jgi:hypothetical protein
MTAQRSDAPAQGGLWGPQLVPDSHPAHSETNDLELIADVIRAALDPGYVLIGPARRVFRRIDSNTQKGAPVETVPTYEQDAVHQLLDRRHLTIGGTHIVSYSGRQGPANSVLVKKASRAMVTRWGNYRPLR